MLPHIAHQRFGFQIDGRPYSMQVGKVYEINNQQRHSVMNKGGECRINFIFDYVPPECLQQAIATGGNDQLA